MNRFSKTFLAIAIGATALTSSLAITAYANEKTVMVGGAPMYLSKNIIQNATHSKVHTTLVSDVRDGSWLCENCYTKKMYKIEFSTKASAGDVGA